MKAKKPDKIKFKYIFDHNYNPKYVNGAYGGITPKGEIAVHFYLERQGLPNSQTYELTKNRLGEEIEKDPDDLHESMIRFVDTGVILNVETAKEVICWLQEKVNKLNEIKKKDK
ncbi:MAG TPA: hypothetical protein PKW56_00140 [Clostridiales bacterium]|nr:hypothetical protein [Clostridiales bacterium]